MKLQHPARVLHMVVVLALAQAALQAQLVLPKAKPPGAAASQPSAGSSAGAGAGSSARPAAGGDRAGASGAERPHEPGLRASRPDQARKDKETLELSRTRSTPAAPGTVGTTVEPDLAASILAATRAELAHQGEGDAVAIARAAEHLLEAGEDGLRAAQVALAGEEPAVCLAGARALLLAGDDESRDLVLARLSGKLPGGAAAPLFELVRQLAPAALTNERLAAWLDHPQSALRAAAERGLDQRRAPELLPLLSPALRSSRVDTRLRALALVERTGGEQAMLLLAASLSDGSAEVAYRAAGRLADSSEPAVEALLRQSALSDPLLSRPDSYALLSMCLREERTGRELLGEPDTAGLLANLRSPAPLARGAAAIALAGIGFASAKPEDTRWLDLDVPHELVRILSGADFHADLSALRELAGKRMALLGGEPLGDDGPAWQRWWMENAAGFRARRAVLAVSPADHARLSVDYRSLGEGLIFGLARLPAGAASDEPAVRASTDSTERLWLSARQAEQLFGRLGELGLYSAACKPGVRSSIGGFTRVLELRLDGQSKLFGFPIARVGAGASAGGSGFSAAEAGAAWFEAASAECLALYEANSWQKLCRAADEQGLRAAIEAEQSWWQAEHGAAERARRRIELALAALGALAPADPLGALAPPAASYASASASHASASRAHDAALQELAAHYAEPGLARAHDFEVLCELLRARQDFDAEARVLATSARLAAGTPLSLEAARALAELSLARFGPASSESLAELLAAAPPGLAALLARHAEPAARAAAAAALLPQGEGLELLSELSRDADSSVAVAAILALGQARVESSRTELLARADSAHETRAGVRAAALRALGRLGPLAAAHASSAGAASGATGAPRNTGADRESPDALALFMRALSDSDIEVQTAAAEALGDYADPDTVLVLISLLSRGNQTRAYQAASSGLLRLGPAAWGELLRVARARAHAQRRTAIFLLARQGVPEVASTLIEAVGDAPGDGELAWELAVLSGLDARASQDPAQAWWDWWDRVPHGDALAWFLEGVGSTTGLAVPAPEALRDEGTQAGALFLLQVLSRSENHLVERARRELSRLLGRDLGDLPAPGEPRQQWIAELRGELAAR